MNAEELNQDELLKAYEKIVDEICSMDSSIIVHYTSPEGLKGIIENRTLRFTDSEYLNDKSEGKLIYDTLEFCIDYKKYEEAFRNDVKDIVIKKISPIEQFMKHQKDQNYKYRYVESKQTAFLCCFSFNDDSLAMWNYYTKNQNSIGFNLCLDKRELMLKMNQNEIAYVTAMPVVYDENSQNEIIEKILDVFYDMWKRTQKNKKAVIEYLADLIDSVKFSFKHSSFKHEEEYRIVLYIYNNKVQELLRNKIMKLQSKNGIFIPYLDVKCVDENSLKQIMVSPSSQDEIVEAGVHNLLNYFNFDGVQVVKSDSPSRY